jgi:hypothetical protein
MVRIPHAFLARRARHRLVGARLLLELDEVALLDDAHRDQHVVEDRVVGNRSEERPPDGIDGAGRADGGARAPFVHRMNFSSPVEGRAPPHRRAGAVGEHQLAAHRPDTLVGKPR